MKTKVLKRLSEPSTYAGLAGLAVIAGMQVDVFQVYANAVAAIFGVLAIIFGEGK